MADEYKTLTYLMVGEEKIEPGTLVSRADLLAAGQTDENITQLLDSGALSSDKDAEINEAHTELESPPLEMSNGQGDNRQVRASEKGEIK